MVLIVTINPAEFVNGRVHSNGSKGKVLSAMSSKMFHGEDSTLLFVSLKLNLCCF
jgi:hypothetical protein